jgi:cytidine deaminase
MTDKINLEYPNISLRQYPKKSDNLFSLQSCQVAVNYWIYDKKKKIIVESGSSRACGCNYHKSSIHAEQKALEYLRKNTKNKSLKVYIWRWGKRGEIKSTYCCVSCSQLLNKYGYQDNIFTFDNDNIPISAMKTNPELSLAYKIKYDLAN